MMKEERRAAYMAEYRADPKNKKRARKREQTPEYKARDRKRKQTPEYKAKQRERRQAPEHAAYLRAYKRERATGVSPTEFNFTLAGQNFCCAKCGADEPGGNGWNADHCHETDRFRGVLCMTCNTGIGKLGDNVEGLLEAVEYILGEALPTNLTKQILQMDGRLKASPPIEPNARPRPSFKLVSSSPNFVGQSRRSA